MINWKIFLTKNKYLLILIIAVVVLSLLPVFDIALMVQGAWQGVISTEIYADSQYYHSRLKEIQDGHLLMGNPYYIEHVNDFPPAFFFADWLAAIPLFLGFSLTTTLIADFILWSIIFCLLAYGFFWQAGFQKKWSAVSSFLVYLIVYIPMLRPVVFQVVFPVFLFILLSLAIWLKDPLSKKKIFLLAVAIALGFYTYTYLMQIVIVLVGLWLLFFLLAKKFNNFYGFLKIFLIALVLSVPFIFFMIKQTGAPYYWETMVRHALVYTHLPTANVVYSGKWVIFMLLLWLAGRLFVQKIKNDPQYNFYFNFFNILGAALLITSVSNVITGKEFEISMHIEYFIIVWLGLSFAVFLCFILKNIDIIRQIDFKRQIVLTVLSLACGAGALFYFWHYSPVVFLQEDRAVNNCKQNYEREIQTFAAPLRWLDEQERQPQVIWASYDSPINVFIPILTKHYVLFADGGKLQLISSEEQKERYLVSGFARNLSQADITDEFVVYAGRRLAIYEPNTHNRQVRVCQLLSLNLLGYDCGKITDVNSLAGENFFQDLYKRYLSEIKPNINQELKKFQVAYIIKDKQINKNFEPEKLNGAKKVYSDERFEVYKLN